MNDNQSLVTQLPLPVTLPVDETFSSFVSGPNEELVSLLSALGHGNDSVLGNGRQSLITIVGSEGRGKSHLLYALCHRLEDNKLSHVYLNLEDAAQWHPSVFEGLESLHVICLDNIHTIAGKSGWENALFDLINRVVEVGKCVLVCSSQLGPNHPDFVLPDLRSRLTWGLTYQLQPLTDDDRKTVIRERAEQRGLRLSEQALVFLLHHADRDLPNLMALLERLDTRSLQEQKKLSVAMVKRELGLD